MKFAKGHGTQNDFVLLPDPEGRLTLAPAAVAALCDRRRGLGADGVLRVTTLGPRRRSGVFERIPEGVAPDDWYMDYRNADGSIAQMCGNGVRVFAHYLRACGLESRDEFVVGSLAGPRPVVLHDWDATGGRRHGRDGQDQPAGQGEAIVGGRPFAGLAIDVGNPHLACVDPVMTLGDLAAIESVANRLLRRRFLSSGVRNWFCLQRAAGVVGAAIPVQARLRDSRCGGDVDDPISTDEPLVGRLRRGRSMVAYSTLPSKEQVGWQIGEWQQYHSWDRHDANALHPAVGGPD